jgi:serine/threonine-protein kinase
MQAERWKQIEDLCQAALELAPEKRAAFLAQACSDDAQLRGEVQPLSGCGRGCGSPGSST